MKLLLSKISITLLIFALQPSLLFAENPLPDLPDKEGFAGVFAGVSHGALIVAGGANFPDRKPWEGGTKVWHDTVYVLENKTSAWKVAGRLPRQLAYGVAATYGDSVILVGGAEATKHQADALIMTWHDGQLTTKPLPALPQPLAYSCGTVIGTTLYLSGGQTAPETPAVNALYRLDLASKEPQWETLKDCPGPGRMLAAAANHGSTFIIAGGVTLVKDEQGKWQRQYLDTVYSYDDKQGWQELAKLPRPSTAAPSPCPSTTRGFLLLGGDDGSQLSEDPLKHRGFRREIWEYDAAKNHWSSVGRLDAPRVTTPCVSWQGKFLVPTGEVKPGRRTPTISVLNLSERRAEDR
jgi:N-acetylneuraminate epimerase